ncbi:MAG TPA: hypothetical protein VEW46_02030 [Pyrinomonadaceae bacterium]|nr:hypothetical protein [Pyrinomonadaceae bacterium]
MKEQIHHARLIGILPATGIALYLCWLVLRPFMEDYDDLADQR